MCFFSALSSSSIRVVIAIALCLVESMFFCGVEHDVLEASPPLLVVALEGFGLSQYRYHWLLYVSQEICTDLFAATAHLSSCLAAVDEVVLNLVCPHHILYILSLLSMMSLSGQELKFLGNRGSVLLSSKCPPGQWLLRSLCLPAS